MSTGLKANVDGSAAIQVGGVDAITLTSAGAASFVTSPMTIQGGSASAPSLTFSGDTNTGIFSPAADTIAFSEGGVESMRVDSAGRLLIGTTSAIGSWGSAKSQEFQIAASGSRYPGLSCYAFSTTGAGDGAMINLGRSRNSTVGTMTQTQSGDVLGYLIFEGVNSSNALVGGGYISVTQTGSAGSTYIPASMTFFTSDAANGNTPRMVIDPTGNLLVGATSAPGSDRVYISRGSDRQLYLDASTSGSGVYTTISFANQSAIKVQMFWLSTDSRFYVQNNTLGVYLAQNGTSWTSASDERLKTGLVPIENAIDKVSALRSVTGRFLTDEETVSRSFLIAQDVQTVFPQAVDTDDPEKLGVRYTDTIPLLVAAIKELKAELDATKAEVALLKGAA